MVFVDCSILLFKLGKVEFIFWVINLCFLILLYISNGVDNLDLGMLYFKIV